MIKKSSSNKDRAKRHRRIRKKLSGTSEAPRLCVFKSQKHIYAQLVDDMKGATVASASSLDEITLPKTPAKAEPAKAEAPAEKGKKKEAKSEKQAAPSSKPSLTAKAVGELVAKRALEKGVKRVVFDRAGFRFHGRVKALADGAREAGLQF